MTEKNVELGQVDMVYMLDDDEGPPITQASQIMAREFVHPTDQELGSASTEAGFDEYAEKIASVQGLENERFRSKNMIEATNKDEQYSVGVEAALKDIDALYEKNMAALDADLAHKKATKGKENMVQEFVAPNIDKWKGIISAEACLDLKENEADGEGSRKRKIVNSEFSDNEEYDDDDYEYEFDDSSVNSDDADWEGRFVDTDFELEDDTELADLLAERKKQWSHISKFMEGEARSSTVQRDDVDSDSEWLEPGDDVESDELHSYSSSDSDGPNIGKSRLRRDNRFVTPKANEDVMFQVKQLFISKKEFQNACKHHGTISHRRIRFKRTTPTRCTAYCTTTETCTWKVCVNYRKENQRWELTSMIRHHSCTPTFNHGCSNTEYLAQRYKEDILIMPNITIAQLIDKIKKDLHIIVSRGKAFSVKKLAMKYIEGDWREQCVILKDYCKELRRANPGSTVVLQTEKNAANMELFRRLYVCFKACKKGFVEGCRHLLGMDGCHLRGTHKGILLTAIGIDANDQIFPVAYAVVEIECTSSWLWFLTLLRKDLGIKNSSDWTLLTDKQKGLDVDLTELFPAAEHRMCTWHMYRNFKADFSSLELKEILWAAAKSTHPNQFNRNLKRIRDTNLDAYSWIMEGTNPEIRARAFFKIETKCDILVNNICECFNRVILEARAKSILTLLEALRFYFMDRLQKKRVFISRIKGPLGPKVRQKLERSMAESNQWFATHVGDYVFEVKNCHQSMYEVRLEERLCSCRKWQLSGIPCAHAVAAISHTKEEPHAFVDHYYSREMYLKAYKYIIYPINGPELWDISDEPRLLPPRDLRLPGRPKKARMKCWVEKLEDKNKKKKEALEKVSRAGKMKPYKCRLCKESGHTQKTCPTKVQQSENALAKPPISKKPRRKRKQQTFTSCGKFGHNKTTCSTPISERFQPTDHSDFCGDALPPTGDH